VTNCVDLQKTIFSLIVIALFWILFLVELRYLLAFRAGRVGTSVVAKWQYVNTALIFVLFYILFLLSSENLVYWYIPGKTDCETALMGSRVVWVVLAWTALSAFLASLWGLTLVSYAVCAVVEDRACTALIPVLVLRTLVTGFFTWLFIVGLAQNISPDVP